jgi:predicted transposase/invertase (TIGR01784 family)
MDMLYRIPSKNGNSLYLYVLFEHKSYHDPKIYFQLLKSLLKIYQWQMQTEKKLSIILPFVFYHGKEKWNLGYSFRDLFELKNTPEEVQTYIPNFAIDVFELSPKEKEIRTESRYLNLYLRLLQIIRESSLDFQRDFLPLLKELSKENDTSKKIEILGDLVQYILSTRKDAEKYTKREAYELLGGEFMTVLDKIIAKGKEEGREEGKLENKLETARKMREKDFSIFEIIEITGLSEEQLNENGTG